MSQQPVGFMSYVRLDDNHENGRLTEFCERLSGEVRMQTGEVFHIFQDRNDVAWGQQWEKCVEQSIDTVTFLIPIITPAFFKSPACRAELKRFMDREKQLKREDLILPVYYVNCKILNNAIENKEGQEIDPLAEVIAKHQYVDWRELRFEPFTSLRRNLADMAEQIVKALERGKPAPLPRPASASVSSQGIPPIVQTYEADILRTLSLRSAEKTEPPTRIVDAFHRGDHTSLTDALQAAKPGDRILVRPGLYKESIVIDKPVEIIGDGEVGEVVIEGTEGDTIWFRASMGRIANLTLRQLGGRNEYSCISITQGRLDVEGCDISSRTTVGTCVDIGGGDPRLRRNRIHGGTFAGVFVYKKGQGTLEDNDIFDNEIGVIIMDNANLTLRRNRITKNADTAIRVYGSVRGVFEENDLRGNTNGAWDFESEVMPNIRRVGNQE